MKRIFLFLVLVSFITSIFPKTVQAGVGDDHSATRSDFDPFCGVDGRSCACKVALKNRSTGEVYFVDGTTGNHDPSNIRVVALNTEDHSWQYAFYVGRPSNSQTTHNCYVSQSKSEDYYDQDGINWDTAIGCAIGVTAGSLVPIPGAGTAVLAACIAGEDNTVAAATKVGSLFTDPSEFFNGKWIGMRKTDEDFLCMWDEDEGSNSHRACTTSEQKGCSDTGNIRGWRVGGWYSFDDQWDDRRISRIAFMGHRGSVETDEQLCGIAIIKVDEGTAPRDLDDPEEFALCNQIPGREADFGDVNHPRGKCTKCIQNDGIWTALGCLSTKVKADEAGNDLITDLVGIGLGIAGGIALLLILAGSATYAMSQGDPKRATDAKETITAAVIGLLFIIFSVTILQFIGVTILRIPGF